MGRVSIGVASVRTSVGTCSPWTVPPGRVMRRRARLSTATDPATAGTYFSASRWARLRVDTTKSYESSIMATTSLSSNEPSMVTVFQ